MSGDIILEVFALIGMVAFLVILASIGYCVFENISSKIADLKWEYKYKHRFDGPPLAKCYCKDCKDFLPSGDGTIGDCIRFRYIRVTDHMFCCKADPRRFDPEER